MDLHFSNLLSTNTGHLHLLFSDCVLAYQQPTHPLQLSIPSNPNISQGLMRQFYWLSATAFQKTRKNQNMMPLLSFFLQSKNLSQFYEIKSYWFKYSGTISILLKACTILLGKIREQKSSQATDGTTLQRQSGPLWQNGAAYVVGRGRCCGGEEKVFSIHEDCLHASQIKYLHCIRKPLPKPET